ncbi:hypothetical protein [Cellulomonas xiejunii]|uniref:hypothetical protein n=1 Tax=Cellulomonas xiejunii TaxID=2968083 RepID=UPI001D0F3191|nr:hypothetical protein [Cellulomonas xiejunii]MCC2312769.1 hypothetical protein [Cellulomonas xiejunii]
MGYTLELRVGSVDAVVAELAAPTLTVADVASTIGFDLDDEVVDRWSEIAQGVAQGTATAGGLLDEDSTAYVVAVLHRLTHWYGALVHSSSGGEEFRAFLAGPADETFGGGLVEHLLGRELAGTTLEDDPSVGWVSNADLRAAVARGLPDDCGHLGPEDEEDLVQLIAMVQRAAAGGLDLFAVYA